LTLPGKVYGFVMTVSTCLGVRLQSILNSPNKRIAFLLFQIAFLL
jgi:hypothetical protein